jgi:hypothetical protein
MNKRKYKQDYFLVFIVLLSAFSLSTCYYDGSGSSDSKKYFDWELRGTWVSADPSVYSGRIEIDFNTIKITGYYESQTPKPGNDNQRPFKNVVKGIDIKGYSNEGKIYIEGFYADGIPYQIYTSVYHPYDKRLKFTFSGRDEILKML